jgi:hypothetical protein
MSALFVIHRDRPILAFAKKFQAIGIKLEWDEDGGSQPQI